VSLISRLRDMKTAVEAASEHDLIDAAGCEDLDRLEAILKVNPRLPRDSALDIAAWSGRMGSVKALIESKANVNCRDKSGWTPLIKAAYRGHLDVVRVLIRAKADVRYQAVRPDYVMFRDDPWPIGYTALTAAAENGHGKVCTVLAEAGADVNLVLCLGRIEPGKTPLMLAAEKGHVEAVRALIQAKADVRFGIVGVRSDWPAGHGALALAAQGNHVEIDCQVQLELILSRQARRDYSIVHCCQLWSPRDIQGSGGGWSPWRHFQWIWGDSIDECM